ncbi:MAG: DivIVA domain-containing protein [Oscillospiraceae bacterium]|nr:DivIVA domain-containing protein [Oscillospiraceae bacterium]
MSVYQNIKFSRARSGYDPQEVDAVLEEMQREIEDMKQRNQALNDSIAQFNERVRLLAESAKRLEDERIKESLRLTKFMNAAAQVAEKIEHDARLNAGEITGKAQREASVIITMARQEAERVISKVNEDFAMAKTALNKLTEDAQYLRQSNDRYINDANIHLAEIDTFICKALNDAPPALPGTPEPRGSFAVPSGDASAAPASPVQTVYSHSASERQQQPDGTRRAAAPAEADPFEEFLKNTDPKQQTPQHQPKMRGRIIGHFGDEQ